MLTDMTKEYNTIIIGGGFYGLRIAQFLREELGEKKVLVIEKEKDLMQRASYNNQARVHNGYHYPRSILTALRSRMNFPIFTAEYKQAVSKDFIKYYAVATSLSKVSAKQFQRFYERIGAKITVDDEALDMFDRKLIEKVFRVEEYVFNTAILKDIVLNNISKLGVEIHTGEKVTSLKKTANTFIVGTNKGMYTSKYVLNTTYSSINLINQYAGLDIIPLKHELTEMCLVKLPDNMQGKAFTIMCGPFYSIMPFPDKGLHTLSHVRYTPHSEWADSKDDLRDSHEFMEQSNNKSNFIPMHSDLKRYMPELAKKVQYTGQSLWEIKTVLPQSEQDDSRPILYKENYGGLNNYICIMGGKIDNIYDVFKELKITYGR